MHHEAENQRRHLNKADRRFKQPSTTKENKTAARRYLQQLEITSVNADTPDDHLMETEHLINQQSTNSDDTANQHPSKNGTSNLILSSEEDCSPAPVENLEPNSAGLNSSRTIRAWHKSLEESHSALIKEKSLLGHLVCWEETQRKILESDIFSTLESEGVAEIGALYKVSPSKFVLAFRSKAAK